MSQGGPGWPSGFDPKVEARKRERRRRQAEKPGAKEPLVRELFEKIDASPFSYKELAERAGIWPGLMGYWRKGSCVPKLALLIAMGEVMGLELIWRKKERKD